MPRKKNCIKSWQANLLHQTVDDVIDSEDSEADSESESEIELECDNEDVFLDNIQSDTELLEFASRLQEAHDWMVAEEQAKRAAKVYIHFNCT